MSFGENGWSDPQLPEVNLSHESGESVGSKQKHDQHKAMIRILWEGAHKEQTN